VTVPAAAVGDTVAVSVILVPVDTESDEAVNTVVVAVVLEEDEVGLLPQPIRRTRVAATRNEATRQERESSRTCANPEGKGA
jgi:hypothetical protein